jgi:hypothetical protein
VRVANPIAGPSDAPAVDLIPPQPTSANTARLDAIVAGEDYEASDCVETPSNWGAHRI